MGRIVGFVEETNLPSFGLQDLCKPLPEAIRHSGLATKHERENQFCDSLAVSSELAVSLSPDLESHPRSCKHGLDGFFDCV
jgi:hypothetical protein